MTRDWKTQGFGKCTKCVYFTWLNAEGMEWFLVNDKDE